MNFLEIEFPPYQPKFDEEALRSLDVKRHKLGLTWPNLVHPPAKTGKDLRLRLPFEATLRSAYELMVDDQASTFVDNYGHTTTYIRGTAGLTDPPKDVLAWIETVSRYVAMKDFLALSFALDFEREGGDPTRSQTEIGKLRAMAKPYGDAAATKAHQHAASVLVERMLAFLEEMTCYESANCVVAMPPSDPSKPYNLPRRLARGIAGGWKREDLSDLVTTVKGRKGLKGIPISQKLETLEGTIKVDGEVFKEKNVLLVDDLYQSGISLNYCALLLLRAGAERVYGLACEKTCRNDDNVRV